MPDTLPVVRVLRQLRLWFSHFSEGGLEAKNSKSEPQITNYRSLFCQYFVCGHGFAYLVSGLFLFGKNEQRWFEIYTIRGLNFSRWNLQFEGFFAL